ncbi:MAG: hypothetical protein LRY57_03350, partial [Alphaproteobacteria bacterium]|nr:hypothetical protein [Alphaproteobacteria bacterium]
MQAAWCRETCWEGCTDEYDAAENPAEGQCLVTTLAAWADNGFADYLQTVLVQADVHPPRPPVWHFNLHHSRLGLYEFDIDPTSQQFPRGSRYATVSRVSIASRQHHEIVYGSLFEPQAAASLERRLTLFLSRMENPGGYKINTSAADKPGSWKMTFALPTPLILKDTAGNPKLNLAINGQKVTGIWNEDIGYFTQMDALYSGISLTDIAQNFSANIGSISIKSNLEERSPGKWSGPLSGRLEKLDILIPDRQMKLSLKSLENNIEFLSYDPALIRTKQQELAAATAANESPGQILFDLLTKSGEGFKTTYDIEGLEIIAPQPGQNTMGKFGLDAGAVSLALSGFSADKVAASISLNYRGLDPRPLSTHLQNVMPREAHLSWELKDVPLQKLSATVQNTFSAAKDNPAATQAGMAALVFKLSALLSQAQTRLSVQKNYMMNDLYRTNLDGGVSADITALLGFSSDFVLNVYGLNNLITALDNAAIEPTTMYRTTLQSWAANLKYFKGFGLLQKDES